MEMNTVNRLQIREQAVCISHTANSLVKGMTPTILSLVEHSGIFNLAMELIKG